jgi:hypothetical protein
MNNSRAHIIPASPADQSLTAFFSSRIQPAENTKKIAGQSNQSRQLGQQQAFSIPTCGLKQYLI